MFPAFLEAANLDGLKNKAIVVAVLALTLAVGAAPALGSPLAQKRDLADDARSKVNASQAQVDATVARYADGRARLEKIDVQVAKASAKLDRLLDKQHSLQQRLDSRADYMYRSGPLGFLEVLSDSATFDEFSSTWDVLSAMGKQDAAMVRDLKRTRKQTAATAKQLMAKQSEAVAQLEALKAQKEQAESQLQRNRATFVSYKRQVAELESEQARKRKARARATRAAAPSAPSVSQSQQGSGEWQSAVCSWYGNNLIGSPMAGGGRVRADSMIVAHKTLPFGTMVEFRYNGRTAVAEVRDRGPFIAGREFDLGPAVARVLGFDGVQTVRYRIIGR